MPGTILKVDNLVEALTILSKLLSYACNYGLSKSWQSYWKVLETTFEILIYGLYVERYSITEWLYRCIVDHIWTRVFSISHNKNRDWIIFKGFAYSFVWDTAWWSRNCLRFRSSWVHFRFLVGFVLLDLYFYMYVL